MTLPRTVLSQRAYEATRVALLQGRFPPGSKVSVRPLSEEFGLSATPVKAALIALEREGFLEAIPHRGFFVPEVSKRDMHEIYELRQSLDGIAARRAAHVERLHELVSQLQDLLDRQRSSIADKDLPAYNQLDIKFHHTIVALSGNTRLQELWENLMDQLLLGSASSAQVPGRLDAALSEHADIITALAAANSQDAEQIAHQHVHAARQAFDWFLQAPRETP